MKIKLEWLNSFVSAGVHEIRNKQTKLFCNVPAIDLAN